MTNCFYQSSYIFTVFYVICKLINLLSFLLRTAKVYCQTSGYGVSAGKKSIPGEATTCHGATYMPVSTYLPFKKKKSLKFKLNFNETIEFTMT